MISIRGLKIIIKSGYDLYGKKFIFRSDVELINADNSKGKSTCINCIIYGLGLEELLGDRNQKALKSVLRKEFNVNENIHKVDESYVYLEVDNGIEVITIKRCIKSSNVHPELISVYKGNLLTGDVKKKVEVEYMYVHRSGAAFEENGFHRYIEKYMGWNLPHVNSFGDKDVKLYIQTVFSAIFIEQVKGWSDFMATAPTYYGIKDLKKRIIEFILDMDVIKNEIKKQKLEASQREIEKQWEKIYDKLVDEIKDYDFSVVNIEDTPESIDQSQCHIYVSLDQGENINLNRHIKLLKRKLSSMEDKMTPTVKDSYKDNYKIFISLEDKVNIIEHELSEYKREYNLELFKINNFKERKNKLIKELKSYKEIGKILKIGAAIDTYTNHNICPTCHQKISDTLSEYGNEENVMTVEENINYIDNELKMLQLVINNSIKAFEQRKKEIQNAEQDLLKNIEMLRTLKNEFLECDEVPSEGFITKKVQIKNKIELYSNILEKYNEKVNVLNQLWNKFSDTKKQLNELPHELFSLKDKKKIKKLLEYFKSNIVDFGYISEDVNKFVITEEKGYIPTIRGINIRMDNSSSDYIRAIWAYTIALFQVSSEFNANHPGIIIFDEPGQQQMKDESVKKLLEKVVSIEGLKCIIGTSYDTKKLKQYNKEIDFKLNYIENRAIDKLVN